jgi:predicted DNA-binding ribbon-helix-helix protein
MMNRSYKQKVIASSIALAVLLSAGVHSAAANPLSPDNDNAQPNVQQTEPHSKLQALKMKFAERQMDRMKQGQIPIIEESAALFGMDKQKLIAMLKDKSLVDVAKERGISEAELVAKLQAERSKKMAEAVKAGKLTQEKADKIMKYMSNHLQQLVNKKGLHEMKSKQHMNSHRDMLPAMDKLAPMLGLTVDELREQLKSGKSLEEIAKAKGMSKDQLVAAIKEQLTPWIEKMVERKRDTKS